MTTAKKYYNEDHIESRIKRGKFGKYYVAKNIYVYVTGKDKAIWRTRFQFQGKRFEKKVAVYGKNNPHFMDYDSAIKKSKEFERILSAGQNPIERTHAAIQTLNDLVANYIKSQSCKYEKEQAIYVRDIKPVLGDKLLVQITRADLEKLLKLIVNSGHLSIARRALSFFRVLFNYANTNNLIIENVASHLKNKNHAGGAPKARQVVLTETEIKKMFTVFQQFPKQVPLRSQIAVALLLIFGFRKCELLSARWSDLDTINRELVVRPTKMGIEQLTVKLPDAVMPLFTTLKKLSKGSSFMFPTERSSTSGHLSESTLNAMLSKLFDDYQTRVVNFKNPLGKAGVRKFWVHDLRRTFSTMTIDHQVSDIVVDRCLNHKKRNSTHPYDQSNRDIERKSVYEMMADIILPLTNLPPKIEDQKQFPSLKLAA